MENLNCFLIYIYIYLLLKVLESFQHPVCFFVCFFFSSRLIREAMSIYKFDLILHEVLDQIK